MPHATSTILQANKTAGDVNLVTLQICRASLVVAAIVSFVASLASGIRPYQRMANAAAAAACALSVRFYGRLIAVRRLPGNAGYRLEGNAVAEAMRVANWTVVVALLCWSAFLLRGPYDDRETQAGAILVRLTYEQWRLWGPLFMAFTAVMSIPIWHLVAIAQGEQNRVTSRVASIAFALVLLVASLIFSSDVFYAIIDERHLCNTNTTSCARTQEERGFATFSCWLWFGYSLIGVLRALARMSTWFSPMQQLKVQNGRVVDGRQSLAPADDSCCNSVLSNIKGMGRTVYTVMVSVSMPTHDMDSMKQIAQWADTGGMLPPASSVAMAHEQRSRPDQGAMVLYNPQTASTSHHHTELAPTLPLNSVLGSDGRMVTMITHAPELSSVCTQILDTLLAVLDVTTQAVVAFGLASLTAPVDWTLS
jgi:hypothetical protein